MVTDLGSALSLGLARAVEVEAERAATILAEVGSRRSWVGATRPLFAHEERARVQFADLDDDQRKAEAQIEKILEALKAAAIGVIVASALRGRPADLTVEEAVSQIQSTRRSWPRALQTKVNGYAVALSEVYLLAAEAGGNRVLGEAARQGAHAVPRSVPNPIRAERAVAAAVRVTDNVVDRLFLAVPELSVLAPTAPATGAGVVELMRDSMLRGSIKQGVDDARQVVHQTYGAGRVGAAELIPDMQMVYASELLDGNTCKPCSHADGREYPNIDAAMEDYPGGGPYRRCEGGARCRGTLIFEWVA